jgi:hypothetical protein
MDVRHNQEASGSRLSEDFDYLAAFQAIRNLASGEESVAQKMRTLIAACETQDPHDSWSAFTELPFDKEPPELARWLREKFAREAPAKPLGALWFGIYNPIDDACGVVADIDVCGSTSYDPNDETFGWAVDPDYVPSGPRARSAVLAALYDTAYRTEQPLGNIAEYPLALGYTAFAVADVFKRVNELPGVVHGAAIAVGFNSGDGLLIGHLMMHGFVLIGHAG